MAGLPIAREIWDFYCTCGTLVPLGAGVSGFGFGFGSGWASRGFWRREKCSGQEHLPGAECIMFAEKIEDLGLPSKLTRTLLLLTFCADLSGAGVTNLHSALLQGEQRLSRGR